MNQTICKTPVDFTVVSEPYTVLKHLETVKALAQKAVRLSDDLWDKVNLDYKVFQERTIENSPVMFHGWEIDVDPESNTTFAALPVGTIEDCNIVLVANGYQTANGHFEGSAQEGESYIYLHVTNDSDEESIMSTLVHELTHYFDFKEGRIQPVDDLVVYLKNESLHDNPMMKLYGEAMYVLWSPTEIRAFTSMLSVQSKGYAEYRRTVHRALKDFLDETNDFLCHFGDDEYYRQSRALEDCFMDKDGVLDHLGTPGDFVHMSERYALPAIDLARDTVLAQLGPDTRQTN